MIREYRVGDNVKRLYSISFVFYKGGKWSREKVSGLFKVIYLVDMFFSYEFRYI